MAMSKEALDIPITQSPCYRNGKLHWYGCGLQEIAERFGTPVHVVAAEAVDSSLRRFREPFTESNLPIEIYFSVKTNPLPVFLHRLNRLGAGFQTVSDFDFRLLQKLKHAPGPVIHTGDPAILLNNPDAVSGLRMFALSTPGQLDRLSELQGHTKQRIPVGLTINPNLVRGYWDITLNSSRRGSPLGFRPGSDLFDTVVQKIAGQPGLDLMGLQLHLGSGIQSADPFLKGIRSLKETADILQRRGHSISLLDIGGGFGLPSAPTFRLAGMVASLLGLHTPDDRSASRPGYLKKIARHLAETVHTLRRSGIQIDTIAAEPGRLLSGGCQLILLTAGEVMHREKGKNFLFCDAGAMSLSPMLLTEHHTVLSLAEKKQHRRRRYEVHGVLPSSLDMVAPSARLPEMEPGDRIAVLDTGAYFLSMNNRFCGPLPPVVWLEEGEARPARMRETPEDLLDRDLLP